MSHYVDLPTVAAAAGISRQAVAKIAKNTIDGISKWRGAKLVVRTVKGRGGRAGLQYQVRIDSLPRDLQERLNAAKSNPAEVIADGTMAAWRDIMHHVIDPISLHPKNSIARGVALRQAAEKTLLDPDTKTLRKISIRTLQRYVAAYERDGMAALFRKKRKDAGMTRVFVSKRWDDAATAAGLDDATQQAIAEQLRTYVRGLHKNSTATGKIQHLAMYHLMRFGQAHGFDATREVCAIPKQFVAAESIYSVVGQYRFDRKAFEDNMPTVRRTLDGLNPMDVVVGDVHSSDILLQDIDGYQRHAKAICWLDAATRRIWVDLVILPKGEGIRNADVIASFRRMIAEWGMARTLYLDNGSEYNWADYLTDAMKLVSDDGTRMRVVIRAKPYGARAKPIEGVFAVLNIALRDVPGFIGGNRMKSKTSNVGKAPTPFPGSHEAFARTIYNQVALYHDRQQHKRGTLGGLSPNQAYDAAIRRGWHKIEVEEHAFVAAFCTEEIRTVDRGHIRVRGGFWTCPELQDFLGTRVTVLIPKWEQWHRLPLKDDKGRIIGFAEEDTAFAFLDPVGGKVSVQRKHLRLVSVREKDDAVPTVDPHADADFVTAMLPAPTSAPVGGLLTQSDAARRVSNGLKETPRQRQRRERDEDDRRRELISAASQKMFENRRLREAEGTQE